MNETGFVWHDGKLYEAGARLFTANNRSFRYGDGFFETMKLIDGRIVLEELHMERLFTSLDTLRFQPSPHLTPARIRQHIIDLAAKNKHSRLARVRLTISRGDGGLYDLHDQHPHCTIQTWPLEGALQTLNENGLQLGIYRGARKSCDGFSHIKSNNYLSYAMAAIWAKAEKLNDALLLNSYERIADATIANVFIVQNGTIKTPALDEGCVSGVMRKHLLQSMRKANMPVEETQLDVQQVLEASELFLTNAISGIRWVSRLEGSSYDQQLSSHLYHDVISPLFSR